MKIFLLGIGLSLSILPALADPCTPAQATAFETAINTGDQAAIDRLLAEKISLNENCPTLRGLGFLSHAVSRLNGEDAALAAKQFAILQSLLTAGADVNRSNGSQYDDRVRPLDFVRFYFCGPQTGVTNPWGPKVADLLLSKGADLNATNGKGWNAFEDAVRDDEWCATLDGPEYFLAKGATKTFLRKTGETPLHWFAQLSYDDMLDRSRWLLKQGVDPNQTNDNGYVALHEAVGNSTESAVRMVRLLVEFGANPLQVAVGGWRTPVSILSEKQDTPENVKTAVAMIQVFLEKGMSPSAALPEALGSSSYHESATAMAEVLLKAGADPNAFEGRAIANTLYALPWKTPETALKEMHLLAAHGAKFARYLGGDKSDGYRRFLSQAFDFYQHQSQHDTLFQALKIMVQADPPQFLPDEHGRTVVEALATQSPFETSDQWMDYLLSIGGKKVMDLKDDEGNVPLVRSAIGGHNYLAAQSLIRNGADVNAKNLKNQTALMYAASESTYSDGAREILKALIAGHAEINAKDINGKTALDYAWNSSAQDVLVAAGAVHGD